MYQVYTSIFDRDGFETEAHSKNLDGELIQRFVTMKHSDGSEVLRTFAPNDEVISIMETSPKIKNKKTVRIYQPADCLRHKEIYYYEDNQIVKIKSTYYSPEGCSDRITSKHYYNNEGLLERVTERSSNGTRKYTYSSNDSYGNWTERETANVSDNFEYVMKTSRKIIYYD